MQTKPCKNSETLLRERKEAVVRTIRRQSPQRIPLFSNAYTWKICDAGYKLREALTDYTKLEEVVCQHHEKYEFDLYIDMGTRNPVRYTNVFGEGLYVFDDEKNYLNVKDATMMEEDEYPELVQGGLRRFYFEKAVPRRYHLTSHEEAMKKWKPAAEEYDRLQEYLRHIHTKFAREYGVPKFFDSKPMFPIEVLFCALRGMRGLSLDFRRNKQFLPEALEVIDAYYDPLFQKALESWTDREDVYFPFRATTMSHNMMSPKQFELYAWPYIKRFVDRIVARDMIVFLFVEGSIRHLVSFFQDIPKGHVALLLEQDDPVKMKKLLPNVTIVGGFPSRLLADGTPQECVDQAKKLIEEMAYDRNYIFGCDKMLSYPRDARPENLQAVNEFVREYGVY